MARYKAVKPKDHRYELAKKRERIRKTVDGVYILLMLIGILICGINQFNNVIVGWGMIVMGIVSIPATFFHIYIDKHKWVTLFWYDTPELKSYISPKAREKDLSEVNFLHTFETVSLIIFSVGLPILGALKLLKLI